MSIERNRERGPGWWTITCDNCDTDAYVQGASFREVVAAMKEAGWQIAKHGDTWEHTCPLCEGGGAAPMRQPEPALGDCRTRDLPAVEARAAALYQILRRAESPVVAKVLHVLTDDELRNLRDLCEATIHARGL